MPQVAIPDALRVVAHQTRGDEEIVNAFHVRFTGSLTQTILDDLAAAVELFYTAGGGGGVGTRGLNSFRDVSVVFDRITIQNIDALPFTDPTEYVYSAAGADAGQLLPLQTALCVTLRTGIANRRGRGRIFLGGFNENANEEAADGYARPTAAFLTAVANAMTDLISNIDAVAVGMDLAVVSQEDVIARPVTSAKVKNVWSTQRRRTESVPITATTLII